jgi:hypothetical protein
MNSKSITFFLVCLLLCGLTTAARACPPPECPNCYYWNGYECYCHEACCIDADCTGECDYCSDSCVCEDDQSLCPGECDYCWAGYCYDDDSKCASDECCDNGTCVDKCTNTGQCDYGELPSGPYPNCEVLKDDATGKCAEAEGLICNHSVIIAIKDAVCADCEPNCDKTRICACAEIIPYRCTTHCYYSVCTCLCDEKPNESYTVGDHYECD